MSVHGGSQRKHVSLQKWLQCKYSIFLRVNSFHGMSRVSTTSSMMGFRMKGYWSCRISWMLISVLCSGAEYRKIELGSKQGEICQMPVCFSCSQPVSQPPWAKKHVTFLDQEEEMATREPQGRQLKEERWRRAT